MKSTHAFRIGFYLLFLFLCLWLGQWIKTHLFVLNQQVLLVLCDVPYMSFSFPIWCVKGVTAAGMLWAVSSIIRIQWKHWFKLAVFILLLSAVSMPIYTHIESKGFTPQTLLPLSCSLILSSVGVAIGYRGLIHCRLTQFHQILNRFFYRLGRAHPNSFLFCMFLISFLLTNLISWGMFKHVPRYTDSCAYLFQARLFAQGMLYAPLPPEPDFFSAPHVILTDKWYTQYPPGHPALLAFGVLFNIPWVVNPLFGALTIVAIYFLAKEMYSHSVARLAAVLSSASSFFLLMSSEFMSHSTTLFLVTSAFLSMTWMIKKKHSRVAAIVCGMSLGIALLCRPYTAFLVCIPLGITTIVARAKLSFRQVLRGTVPLFVGCLALLAYNFATNGHPLRFGYIELHGKGHYPGFHLAPDGEQFHTVTQGFKYLFENLNGLNYYFFEWPMPSLFFACLFLGFGKKKFWEWLLVGWIGVLLLGHLFYYFNEFAFGPRFIYEAFPALILLTCRGIVLSTQWISNFTQSFAKARNVQMLAISGLFFFALLFNVPTTATTYKRYGSDGGIRKYLDKKQVTRALVFVKDRTLYRVHYPFNIPFAKRIVYARDQGHENQRLAEEFPGYRYFVADQNGIREISINSQ